mmetsp:Transcript_71801/g.210368  ORF Transcript_71801/g.210368 Transcript_71801/m.210368 type:complete len:233 (-) Transcript_71801:142-840(-)
MLSASVFRSCRLSVLRSFSSASGTSASLTSCAARSASLSSPRARARCSTASWQKRSPDSSAACSTAGSTTCSSVCWALSLSSCQSMSSAARRTSESRATLPSRCPSSTFARHLCSASSAMASMPAPTAVWCTIASSTMSTSISSPPSLLPEAASSLLASRSSKSGGGSRHISPRLTFTAFLLPGSNTATRWSSRPSPAHDRPATSPRAPKVSRSPLGYFVSVPPKKTTLPRL